MAIHKLNSRFIPTAATGKYEDGGGLRIIVTKTKARKWSCVIRLMVGDVKWV
jgi:hypothetical protein